MTSKNHYPEPRRYQISSWGFALFPVFGVGLRVVGVRVSKFAASVVVRRN